MSDSRCKAWAKSTNDRCKITRNLSADGYCHRHNETRPTIADIKMVKCQGKTPEGKECNARRLKSGDSEIFYCCFQHDPANLLYYVHPKLVRKPISKVKAREIVKEFESKDIYSGEFLESPQIEHIWEGQFHTHVIQKLLVASYYDRDEMVEIKKVALNCLKEVNDRKFNLAITSPENNSSKGKATFSFLDDRMTGNLPEYKSYTSYLEEAYRSAKNERTKRLCREITRKMNEEVYEALKKTRLCLDDDYWDGSSFMDSLINEFQYLSVDMRLK